MKAFPDHYEASVVLKYQLREMSIKGRNIPNPAMNKVA